MKKLAEYEHLNPMAKMRKMAQDAMQEKGSTEKDIRKMIGIERYMKVEMMMMVL